MSDNLNISSSQLYRRAAGIDASGSPAPKPCMCVMCGAHLQDGDLIHPIRKETFGESFNNKLDLKQGGTVVCGDCHALWIKDFLQKYSKSYATADGVFKLASNLDIQSFILTPPKPPFVAIYSTRQQQHMIWRTPVCHSSEHLLVRIDDEILSVNRALVIKAVPAWQFVHKRMKELGIKGMLAYPDRLLASRSTGSIRQDIAAKISEDSPEGKAAIETISRLRAGEWWALTAMSKADIADAGTWPAPEKFLPLAA